MSLFISGLSNEVEGLAAPTSAVQDTCEVSTQTVGTGDDIEMSPGHRRDFNILKRAADELGLVRESSAMVDDQRKKTRTFSKTGDLFEYLRKERITSRTQFESRPSEEILPFLMMQNIESLLPRGFNFVAMQLRKEPFVPSSLEEIPIVALALAVRVSKLRLFLCGVQGWSVKQYKCFFLLLAKVLNGETNKKNCMWVWGPANSGKSTVMASFVDHFFPSSVGKPDNNDRSSFPFNACVNRRVVFWEEPCIHPQNVEDVKCLMSGTTFSTDIKYQSAVEIHKTPLLVTANKVPWAGMADSNVMRSRSFCFKFAVALTDQWVSENACKYFPFSKEDFQMSFLESCSDQHLLNDACSYDQPSC